MNFKEKQQLRFLDILVYKKEENSLGHNTYVEKKNAPIQT